MVFSNFSHSITLTCPSYTCRLHPILIASPYLHSHRTPDSRQRSLLECCQTVESPISCPLELSQYLPTIQPLASASFAFPSRMSTTRTCSSTCQGRASSSTAPSPTMAQCWCTVYKASHGVLPWWLHTVRGSTALSPWLRAHSGLFLQLCTYSAKES